MVSISTPYALWVKKSKHSSKGSASQLPTLDHSSTRARSTTTSTSRRACQTSSTEAEMKPLASHQPGESSFDPRLKIQPVSSAGHEARDSLSGSRTSPSTMKGVDVAKAPSDERRAKGEKDKIFQYIKTRHLVLPILNRLRGWYSSTHGYRPVAGFSTPSASFMSVHDLYNCKVCGKKSKGSSGRVAPKPEAQSSYQAGWAEVSQVSPSSMGRRALAKDRLDLPALVAARPTKVLSHRLSYSLGACH